MRFARVLGALFLFVTTSALGADAPLAELSWISGSWAGTSGDVRQLEYWSEPDGGILVGLHKDVFDDGRSFFEYLRIEQRGDEIFYVAMPRGSGSTDFRLTDLTDRRAAFENPEHDFPTKIVYERDGDTLTATISGLANGETRSKSWSWQRVTAK
jgi:hypothetical protein